MAESRYLGNGRMEGDAPGRVDDVTITEAVCLSNKWSVICNQLPHTVSVSLSISLKIRPQTIAHKCIEQTVAGHGGHGHVVQYVPCINCQGGGEVEKMHTKE